MDRFHSKCYASFVDNHFKQREEQSITRNTNISSSTMSLDMLPSCGSSFSDCWRQKIKPKRIRGPRRTQATHLSEPSKKSHQRYNNIDSMPVIKFAVFTLLEIVLTFGSFDQSQCQTTKYNSSSLVTIETIYTSSWFDNSNNNNQNSFQEVKEAQLLNSYHPAKIDDAVIKEPKNDIEPFVGVDYLRKNSSLQAAPEASAHRVVRRSLLASRAADVASSGKFAHEIDSFGGGGDDDDNDESERDLLDNDSRLFLTSNNNNQQHQDNDAAADGITTSKTHIVALSDQWIELQCPLARELPASSHNPSARELNDPTQQEAPTFISTPSSNSIIINNNNANNPPTNTNLMAIIWRKNGSSVSPSRRIKVNSSNGSLIITSAQPKLDEGIYQCALVTSSRSTSGAADDDSKQLASMQPHSSAHDQSAPHSSSKHAREHQLVRRWKILKLHQFELALVEPPRLAPFEFASDATVGMRVLVTCSILRGQKPISFVWLKDNQIIASSQQQLGGSSSAGESLQTVAGLSLGQLHRQQLSESRLASSSPLSTKQIPMSKLNKATSSSSSSSNNNNNNNEHERAARLDYVIYNQAGEQPAVIMRPSKQHSDAATAANFVAANAANSQGNENQLLALLSDPSIKIKHSDDYSILSIENLELKHSGRYTCSAHNEAARASHSSQLIINAAPSFVAEPKDADLVSGQTARIECAVTGQPKPSITWHRARETGAQQWDYVPIYDNLRYTTFPNGSLQIANVSQREQGFFLCSARNGFDPELTKLIRLTIHEPAKFLQRFRTQEARLDERVSLTCAASGEQPIQLEWLDRDGKPIDLAPSKSDNKYLIDREQDTNNSTSSRLILTKTSKADSGHYTCQATNKFGSDKMITNLLIQHVPDKVSDLKVTNVTGTTISLRWLPGNAGNAPITSYLVQYQSDDPLDDILASGLASSSNNNNNNLNSNSNDNDIIGSITQSLTQDNNLELKQQDGEQAKLRNEMQAFLRSTLGAISTMSTYEQSNDEAIDRTLVELTVEQATSFLVVKDVAPSCLYRLRLAAINKIGLGQFSDWIRAKTEEAPPSASAQKISALATGPNSIKLTWLPPDRRAWNGPLIGFNIGYRPIDSAFELNKTFEWTAPSLQSLIRSNDDQQLQPSGAVSMKTSGKITTSMQNNNASNSVVISSTSANQHHNNSSNKTSTSNNYYLLKQHLRQLVALQQQELVAHLTNLQRSTTYLVWLQAINSRGLSPQSHAISIKTLDDVPPSAPSIKIQSTSASSITLTWSLLNNFISPANQYSLFYRKLPLTMSPISYHSSSSSNVTSQLNHQQQQHSNDNNNANAFPFSERTITSQQLIMAGNLFLGADQVDLNAGSQATSSPLSSSGSIGLLNSNHQQHYQQFVYTLDQLDCGSVYELYMSTRNSVGKSEPSSIVTTRTSGEPPLAPANKNILFARIGFNDVLLNLASWSNGGCPFTHMSIVYKPSPSPLPTAAASTSSNGILPKAQSSPSAMSPISNVTTNIQVAPILLATLNGNDPNQAVIMTSNDHQVTSQHGISAAMQPLHSPVYNLKNLQPNSCYELEIVAHNAAGHTRAQYEFVTSQLNDTRSGFSRKEGIYRIDQRGTLIDSIINDGSSTNNNNQYHYQKTLQPEPGFTTSSSMHLPIQQLEPHQLAPLIFLILCLICLLVSSTFCYYRFRDSWKSSWSSSSPSSQQHHHHHHDMNGHNQRPSSIDTAINLDSASCIHGQSSGVNMNTVGAGGGHASSTICQSSPLSIGKSSMWRINGHFPNTLKQRHYHHHASNDAGTLNTGSPVHYCTRDPMGAPSDHYTNTSAAAAASLLANNHASTLNNPHSFAQSLSMRDFNLINGNIQLPHHNQPGKSNRQHYHHATTLNLKHYRANNNNNIGLVPADNEQQARMSTLRARLISSTPYDNLINPHLSNNGENHQNHHGNNDNENYQQSRLLAAAVAAENQQLSTEYGYNIALNQQESNYNTVPVDQNFQAETSWTAIPSMPTNYAIPASSNHVHQQQTNSDSLGLTLNNGQINAGHIDTAELDKSAQLGECQLDCDHTDQANINVCIQQILNQEYNQQQQQQIEQHYNNMVQQHSNVIKSHHQHAQTRMQLDDRETIGLNVMQQQQQQQQGGKKTVAANSVIGSSSGSSSSGIDIGQQSEVGSSLTADSANNQFLDPMGSGEQPRNENQNVSRM